MIYSYYQNSKILYFYMLEFISEIIWLLLLIIYSY